MKLDLFGHLALGPSTAEEVAERLQGDARAFRIVLDALTALQLLAKRGASYVNTPVSGRYLVPGGSEYVGDQLIVDDLCWDIWGRLEETLLLGKPVVGESIFREDALMTKHLLRGLHQDAAPIASALAEVLPLSEHQHILDLGGGAGTYALTFVRDHPHLRASIFELPKAAEIARRTVDASGLSDRACIVEGDFLRDRLPQGHDMIFMSNVLHGQPPEDNAGLFHRVARAVEPGGLVVVRDVVMNAGLTSPEFGAIFSVNMLLHTAGGRCYSLKEIVGWMEAAGLREISHWKKHSLIVARSLS